MMSVMCDVKRNIIGSITWSGNGNDNGDDDVDADGHSYGMVWYSVLWYGI